MIIKTILFCLGACYLCHTRQMVVYTLGGEEVLNTVTTSELCAELDAHKQAGLEILNYDLSQRILVAIQEKNKLLDWITAQVVFTQPNDNRFELTILDGKWRVQEIPNQSNRYENILNSLRESGRVPKKQLPHNVSIVFKLINNEREMCVRYWYVPKRRMGVQYWHVPNNDCTTAPWICGAELLKSTKCDFRPDTFGFMKITDLWAEETFYLLTGPLCNALEMARVATRCVDTRFKNASMILPNLTAVVYEPPDSWMQSMQRSFEDQNILVIPWETRRMDCRSLCTIT